MKIICSVVLLLVACIAFTDSYPNPRARYDYQEPEMFYMPYEDRRSLQEDTYRPAVPVPNDAPPDAPIDFNPLAYGPLAGFVQSMQAMMKRVQVQMGQVLSRLPPQDIDWGKLGNTTSHTKVVNDHLVTVNETTYKNQDADSHAVLHIKIVDVKPMSSGNGASIPSTVESVKQRGAFGGMIDRNYPDTSDRLKQEESREYGNLDPTYLDDVDNSVDVFQPMNPIDLSRDTLVNNLKQGQSKGGLVMIDPDAELIDLEDGKVRPSYQFYSPQNFYNQQRSQPIFP